MERKQCYASDKNKGPILEVLRQGVQSLPGSDSPRLLEIASGTGEHAHHFASALPHLSYQPTEPMREMHDSIRAWTSDLSNVLPPIALDISQPQDANLLLPKAFLNHGTDIILCINMIHISPFPSTTEGLFQLAQCCLTEQGFLLTYGPYRIAGHLVESNQAFDNHLKSQNENWGIRDLEDIEAIALKHGIVLRDRIAMPANNFCLIFTRNNNSSTTV